MPSIDELVVTADNLDDAVRAFRRYRWLALEEYERGDREAALDRLKIAVALRDKIRAAGGKTPF